jgi:hypothetical protein
MHNRERVWRTADGRGIAVKDMQLGHLVNVINWVLDNSDSYPNSILNTMVAEANYRKLILFAEGKDYPQQVGSRWKVIDAKTGNGSIQKPPADYIEAVKGNEAYQHMSKRTQELRKKSST